MPHGETDHPEENKVKALLVVDMQNDFMPGGALEIPRADEITLLINGLMEHFSLVVATQDWHPKNHMSFASNHPGAKEGETIDIKGASQVLWPSHCVQNSPGAELVSALDRRKIDQTFHKGTDQWIDSYSAFFDNAHRKKTGLAAYLFDKDVDEIYLAGVATDYCVYFSALDALELGFKVSVIVDACLGIDLKQGDVDRALGDLKKRGVRIVTSESLNERFF